MLTFLLITVYNFFNNSKWGSDTIFSMVWVTIFYFSIKKFSFTVREFIFINLAFLVHCLGSFNLYSIQSTIIGYDTFVHLFSTATAGYIAIRFLNQKKSIKTKFFFTALMAISIVAFLGIIIETIEYGGNEILGTGDGMFRTGSEDTNGKPCGIYNDTMTDIITNTLGSILGILIYSMTRAKKATL